MPWQVLPCSGLGSSAFASSVFASSGWAPAESRARRRRSSNKYLIRLEKSSNKKQQKLIFPAGAAPKTAPGGHLYRQDSFVLNAFMPAGPAPKTLHADVKPSRTNEEHQQGKAVRAGTCVDNADAPCGGQMRHYCLV
jgi:hypothetical protein